MPRHPQVFERYTAMQESMPEGSAGRMELPRNVGLKIEELRARYTLLVEGGH